MVVFGRRVHSLCNTAPTNSRIGTKQYLGPGEGRSGARRRHGMVQAQSFCTGGHDTSGAGTVWAAAFLIAGSAGRQAWNAWLPEPLQEPDK
jgi:hypothetical protein